MADIASGVGGRVTGRFAGGDSAVVTTLAGPGHGAVIETDKGPVRCG